MVASKSHAVDDIGELDSLLDDKFLDGLVKIKEESVGPLVEPGLQEPQSVGDAPAVDAPDEKVSLNNISPSEKNSNNTNRTKRTKKSSKLMKRKRENECNQKEESENDIDKASLLIVAYKKKKQDLETAKQKLLSLKAELNRMVEFTDKTECELKLEREKIIELL